jgi:protein SCO1/2
MTDPTKRRFSINTIAAAVGGIVVLLIVIFIGVVPRLAGMAPEGPSIGGPFSLIDQYGHTATDADFRGKLMLIYFGYTYCPDVCPTTLATIAQAYEQLTPAEQAEVVPIFITVDPERDTVDQIAQYVDAFSPALIGLTGSPEQLAPVLKEFRVYARKADTTSANYTVDHTSILYLMDKRGRYVDHFSSGLPARDIAAALKKQLAG